MTTDEDDLLEAPLVRVAHRQLAASLLWSGIRERDWLFLRCAEFEEFCRDAGLRCTGRDIMQRLGRIYHMGNTDLEKALKVGLKDAAGQGHMADWLAIYLERRASLPPWLRDAMQRAVAREAARTPPGARLERLPLVVLRGADGEADDDLALLRLRDFREWFGPRKLSWPK